MGDPSEKEQQNKERTGSRDSRALHCFTLPTPLKWGHQRPLRCMKAHPNYGGGGGVAGGGGGSASSGDRRRGGSGSNTGQPKLNGRGLLPIAPSGPKKGKIEMGTKIGGGGGGISAGGGRGAGSEKPPGNHRLPISPSEPNKEKKEMGTETGGGGGGGGESEIEAVRQKLVSDLKLEADRMKQSLIDENERKKASEEELNDARPWNLRSKRGGGGSNRGGGGGISGLSPGRDGGEGGSGGGTQMPEFSASLTKEEIEADFIAMTGAKPPRRPKKRPRAVQKQCDALNPGSWLGEVTPDSYRVENGDHGKGG